MFFAAKKIDSRQRHQKSLPTVFGAVCSSISVYPLVGEADEQRHAGSALPAHSAGPGLRHAVTRITAGTFCRDKDAFTTCSKPVSICLYTCDRRLLLRLVEDAGRPPPLEYPGLVLVYCIVMHCTAQCCTVPGECGGWAQRGTSAAHSSGSSETLKLG